MIPIRCTGGPDAETPYERLPMYQRTKDGTTIKFETFGSTETMLPTEMTDRNGNTVTYERDAGGRLLSMTDNYGRALTFTHNGQGKVTEVADGTGRTQSYTYDDVTGDMTSETDPNGDVTSYVYDAEHRITQVTFPNGGKRYYTYDAESRVTEEKDDLDNNKKTYVYDETNRKTTVTDALGRDTVYEWNEIGGLRLVGRIVDPLGGKTRFNYDTRANLISQIDALGRVTEFRHDVYGNVVSVTDPAYQVSSIGHEHTFHQPVSVVDSRGNRTQMFYDSKGNMLQVKDALGNFTHMSYDDNGNLTGTKDPLGKVTAFAYDANGALAGVTDALGRTTAMERDGLSRVTGNTDAKGKRTDFAYDATDNLTKVTDHTGGITSYEYQKGRESRLLKKVVDARLQLTGKGTVFGYDPIGRLTSVTNALNQSKTFGYDLKGNLKTITDAKSQNITFDYDGLDRLITKHLPEGDVTYTYDLLGNLTKVQNHNGSIVEMSYDSVGRVTQVIQRLPDGYSATISYGYDLVGNRTSMITPWGSFSYSYDQLNRLTSITNPDLRTITFEYDANGRRRKMSYPNGIETTYAYDPAGQLTQILHAKGDNAIAFANYTYDAAGNRKTMTDMAGTHIYEYDDLHRLIAATHPLDSHVPTKNEVFAYDAVGNRLYDANITGYQYDEANRLLENSSYTYTHDANGSMTSKTGKQGQGTTAYTYNAENQLIRVDLPNGTRSSYKYDALGRRIEKSTGPIAGPSVVRYVYDSEDILAMQTAEGSWSVFTHGPGIDEPLIMKQGQAEFFYSTDDMGSIILLTTSAGAVAEKVTYAAFGKPVFFEEEASGVLDHSVTESPFAFTGRELDNSVGLAFHRARFLDFTTGRFTQEDPAYTPTSVGTLRPFYLFVSLDNPSARNLYSFAGNAPTNSYDPDGYGDRGRGWKGKERISGDDRLTKGKGKHTSKEELKRTYQEIEKILKDKTQNQARKRFLKAWMKWAKRGFKFAVPFVLFDITFPDLVPRNLRLQQLVEEGVLCPA